MENREIDVFITTNDRPEAEVQENHRDFVGLVPADAPTIPSWILAITQLDIQNWNNAFARIENDPTVPEYVKSITQELISHWNEAYARVEQDPTVPSFVKEITQQNIENWNEAYQRIEQDPNVADFIKAITQQDILNWNAAFNRVEQDPTVPQFVKNITAQQIANWNAVFGDALRSESDPTVPSFVKQITQQNIENWNNAFNRQESDPTVPSFVKAITQNEINKWNYFIDNFAETDPTVPNYVKNITQTEISNWNTTHNEFENQKEFTTNKSETDFEFTENELSTGLTTYVERTLYLENKTKLVIDTLNFPKFTKINLDLSHLTSFALAREVEIKTYGNWIRVNVDGQVTYNLTRYTNWRLSFESNGESFTEGFIDSSLPNAQLTYEKTYVNNSQNNATFYEKSHLRFSSFISKFYKSSLLDTTKNYYGIVNSNLLPDSFELKDNNTWFFTSVEGTNQIDLYSSDETDNNNQPFHRFLTWDSVDEVLEYNYNTIVHSTREPNKELNLIFKYIGADNQLKWKEENSQTVYFEQNKYYQCVLNSQSNELEWQETTIADETVYDTTMEFEIDVERSSMFLSLE